MPERVVRMMMEKRAPPPVRRASRVNAATAGALAEQKPVEKPCRSEPRRSSETETRAQQPEEPEKGILAFREKLGRDSRRPRSSRGSVAQAHINDADVDSAAGPSARC